jgi:hypothetical protein
MIVIWILTPQPICSEQLQLKEATHHLKTAATIFTDINHEIGAELVQAELEPMTLERFSTTMFSTTD